MPSARGVGEYGGGEARGPHGVRTIQTYPGKPVGLQDRRRTAPNDNRESHAKGEELLKQGTITQAEFEQIKQRAISG